MHKRSLLRFHDGIVWLMQIAMFLVLGLLVYPSRLPPVVGAGLLAPVWLMFVAQSSFHLEYNPDSGATPAAHDTLLILAETRIFNQVTARIAEGR